MEGYRRGYRRLPWDVGRPSPFRTAPIGATAGSVLLSLVAVLTTFFGIAYVGLALTVTMLPSDSAYLGMSASHLCAVEECRMLDFLSHGRMTYGGALIAIGVMTGWLTVSPLRRGEPWAWWALLFAGIAFYGSFLTFPLVDGYFDWSYALLVGLGLPLSALGLALTHQGAAHPSPLASAPQASELRAWLRHRKGRARLLVAALGAGIGLAGLGILMLAGSVLFVPQDIDFIGLNRDGVAAVNDKLPRLMAHDRIAYGGSMIAIGILFVAIALSSLGSGSKGAGRVLAVSGCCFYVSTLIIHFVISYTSFTHLLPVYGGLIYLLVVLGFSLERRPRKALPIPSD